MKIHIGKSKLHGKGLLASRDIKKGEIIFIIKGKKINFLIDSKQKAQKAGLNWIGWGKNKWIDPARYALYFNHSCEPNSGIRGKVTIVALCNIKMGEEVTFDYSLNESDVFWHIRCNCGSKSCRKTIRSVQFLPPETFRERVHSIPKYFQNVYKRYNAYRFKSQEELKIKWVGFIAKGFSV